jgi:hypothetical protein
MQHDTFKPLKIRAVQRVRFPSGPLKALGESAFFSLRAMGVL